MKSTFSRNFFPAAISLLATLLLVGTSFRALVKDYLEDHALDSLEADAVTISDLATAYYTEGSLSSRDFLVNLSISSQITASAPETSDDMLRLTRKSRLEREPSV